MQQRQPRFFLFMVAAFGFMLLFQALYMWLYPPLPQENKPDETGKLPSVKTPLTPPGLAGTFAREAQQQVAFLADRERQQKLSQEDRPTNEKDLVTLGSVDATSPFHLRAQLDPRGAGLRSVLLNKFPQQDEDGRPIDGHFELVPAAANASIPANVLYHYPNRSDREDREERPADDLGRVVWKAGAITMDETEDGRKRQTVDFSTEIEGVEIVKRFTLVEREYHLGLEVKMTRKVVHVDRRANRFRYQLIGSQGMPIEGKWYTSFFRTALIAQEQNGSIFRDYQDVRQIGLYRGGHEVPRDSNRFFRYAGVVVQYFASVVVVDPSEGQEPFIARARPTLERSVLRGTLKSVARDASSFVLQSGNQDYSFQVPSLKEREKFQGTRTEIRIAVVNHIDRFGSYIADEVAEEHNRQPLWEDDITVRLTSENMLLEKDQTVTHRYLLYNGPVKPALLAWMKDEEGKQAAVPTEVVRRYTETLKLNTLTDYQSPGWVGNFSSAIYWTPLVINVTNMMHWVLNQLYLYVPNYGLCVILMTVLVRGMMFPLSLKQARTMMKMQEVAPELKALQEKHKGDQQGMAQAQMDLYRKHGINPFGTCWVVLLQLPVFMGLWYALQESVFFRLAPFWGTYIVNLAAPDMLYHWGRNIMFLSTDSDYSSSYIYLGPYLNLLPLFSVALMLVQQKLMTPPPTNEQEEANQRVMTIMMCVMGLLFYKIAAGVAIYFIASSLWGVAERQFLPKAKKDAGKTPGTTTTAPVTSTPSVRLADGPSNVGSTTVTTSSANGESEDRGRPRKGKKAKKADPRPTTVKTETTEPEPTTTLGRMARWWRQRRKAMADWWAEVLRQAEKK